MLPSLQRKIIGDLRANWKQFLAVWLVVTLGTTFYGAMYPAGVNMLASFNRTYEQLHYMGFQVRLYSAQPEAANKARQIPGVASVEGRLIVEAGLQLDPASDYLTSLRLISVPDRREPEVNLSSITAGRQIESPDEILLLESFAAYHGLRPGDTVHVSINGHKHDLRVAGLAFNPEYLVPGQSSVSPFPSLSAFGVAWIRYSRLARLVGREGEINDIAVYLNESVRRNKTLKDGVREALEQAYDDYPGFAIYAETQTASGGIVDANINGNFPIMEFFSGAFLIGSTLVTGILLTRLVESEHQRIGTLRAMGLTRREIIQHYLTFGLIVGVSGGAMGSVLGYLNSFWVMNTFIDRLIGGTLPGYVNTPQMPFILLGFFIAAAGSTLSGAYPAWVESGTPPGIALRPALPKSPSALSRIPLGLLPLTLRQTVRNLLRVPGRSIGTALGVLAGSTMIFASFVLWDTMAMSFDNFFGSNDFDLRVIMGAPQSADALERKARKIDGVQAVQGVLIAPVSVERKNGKQWDTLLVAIDERNPFIKLKAVEGEPIFSSVEGVWIGHNVQRVLGVNVGDTLDIEILDRKKHAKVLGIASEAIGSSIFVPRGLFVQWTGNVFSVNTLLVRVAPGQMTAVRDAMADLPEMVSANVMPQYNRDLNRYFDYFRVGTLIFGGFGFILTLAVLFNTVNASLHERQAELAILRALGIARREIALMVTIEILVMVVVGAAIGVPLGRAAGFWLNHTYDTDFFGQVNRLDGISYVLGLSSMIIIALLAEIPGLRAAHQIDLGQVSKSQSI